MTGSACPVPKGSEDYGVRGTAWKPMIAVSGICLLITIVVSLSLIIQHLRRYRSPKEQRQIIRIVFSVIVYSLVAFFEIASYAIAQYIDPIGDLYESFGLCALFLLYIQFAAPSGTFDDDTFHAVKAAEERETKFNWPKISWIFVFQYPIVEFLCIVVQEATQATGDYCLDSLNPKYAHLWVEVIESVSISFCVISILKFYGHMKRLMKARRGLSKLAAFKIIVFIRFAQQWVFSTLLEYHLMKPSSKLSYNDILYGIPATASCVEMALFSFGFWYAFSASEYSSKAKPHERPLPLWKAALDALNPMDLILGLGRIFPLCFEMRRTGDWKEWRVAQRESGVQGATRKAIRKYKNKRQSGAEQGRSQVPGVGMESLSKPAEMHYAHSESDTSYRANPTTGGISGADMYQPPEGSPPGYASEYLTTEQVPYGRPRATSSSSLMAETQPQSSRATSPYAGQWNGQRYEVPETHSPRQSFVEEPTQGRDIV